MMFILRVAVTKITSTRPTQVAVNLEVFAVGLLIITHNVDQAIIGVKQGTAVVVILNGAVLLMVIANLRQSRRASFLFRGAYLFKLI